MYRIEFIDNCNKLRNKWFNDLTNCDLEVYNFIVGVYDENQDLLDKKYLNLTDLERSFYGKLSQVGAQFLIDNVVTQPVIRSVFSQDFVTPNGNNNIKYTEDFALVSFNTSSTQVNFPNATFSHQLGYRYWRLYATLTRVFAVDPTSYSGKFQINVYNGNDIINFRKEFTWDTWLLDIVVAEGFLNTDNFDVVCKLIQVKNFHTNQDGQFKLVLNMRYF